MTEQNNLPSIPEATKQDKLFHDLRNSLSIILMQAQILSQYTESNDATAIKKCAASIEQSVNEMVQLLNTQD